MAKNNWRRDLLFIVGVVVIVLIVLLLVRCVKEKPVAVPPLGESAVTTPSVPVEAAALAGR